jgi:hypothetical protein
VQLLLTDVLCKDDQFADLCEAGNALDPLWQLLQYVLEWQLFVQLAPADALCAFDQLADLCDAGNAFFASWHLLQYI